MALFGLYTTEDEKRLKAELDAKDIELLEARIEALTCRYLLNKAMNERYAVRTEVKGSEAEEAFEPFRKDIAKRIVSCGLTTENALLIARRAFVTGYKKARE